MAVVLLFVAAGAAEPKEAPSLMGLTRDQVIRRYGEPRSQMAVRNQLVMFYPRERLVLRDGVVIEVEPLATEPRRTSPPAPAPAPTPAPPAEATPPPPATPPAERTGAAGAVAPAAPPAASTPTSPIDAPDPTATAPTSPPPEPKLEIKVVRPPGSKYTRPAAPTPKSETPPAPTSVTAPSSSSAGAPLPPRTAPVTPPPPSPVGTGPEPSSSAAVTRTPGSPQSSTAETKATSPAPTAPARSDVPLPANATAPAVDPAAAAKLDEPKEDVAASEKKEIEKKVRSSRARRRIAEAGEPDAPELAEAFYTGRTFVITFLVVGAGLAYLLWRNHQRRIILAATAVSRAPFEPASNSGGGGTTFTSELLAKLEWKRFEELVADYYTKTGVVAVRTKTGPASPVQIKISWKGEPRPFASVRCIAHPAGLVDAKLLQELFAAISAEDIRRGYVVTSGKFSVGARDFAEEKHLTLLPGDIFLEKLNALPEAARSEIMQSTTSGDYETPSCPKCDGKMVKSAEDPSQWRCPIHADQVIPGWR